MAVVCVVSVTTYCGATDAQSEGVAPTLAPSAEAPAGAGAFSAPVRGDNVANAGRVVTVDPAEPQPLPPVAKAHDKSGEFVIAPIPRYDPSQELSIVLVGQYLFHPDPDDHVSPPSIVAAAGIYTQQDSAAGFVAYMGYLDEDRWRVMAGGGAGRFNYSFYGVGNDAAQLDQAVPVEQDFVGGLAQVARRVAPHFYVGPRVQMGRSTINVDASSSPFPLPESAITVDNVALGVKLQFDTRDNTLYPTRGVLVEAQADFFSETFGGDFDYQAYQVEYNQYRSLSVRGVLAWRAMGRFAVGDDIPFFDLSTFGRRSDLRGYEAGKYRDKDMFAAHVEYRYLRNHWIGLAAFAGAGEVFDGADSLRTDELLWSGDAGVRIRLARQNPVFYRADVAVGGDGVAVYLGIGQAF